MYLVRKISAVSFPVVAAAFGRDHSTVIHACQLIERRMAHDGGFRRFIEQLEARSLTWPQQRRRQRKVRHGKAQPTTNMRALRTAREAGQQFSQGAPVGPRGAFALAVFPRAHARERSDV
jgi:Bacterial dnaA protein helix-turn-helix